MKKQLWNSTTLFAPAVALLIGLGAAPLLAEAPDLANLFEVIRAGGGKIYEEPVPQQAFNFQGFPDVIEPGSSLLMWDMDVIDLEIANQECPELNGDGVYVAIVDSGLAPNWRDYFPQGRIARHLGRSFVDQGVMRALTTGVYVPNVKESRDFRGESGHGTHVTSTVIGWGGLSGLTFQGVAPMATIIPVKVLNTYEALMANFGTDASIAAGIHYVADLAEANPGSSFVINMSLGGLFPISALEKAAIDRAISLGVIVVAAAGNDGTDGMGTPGAYAPVISVGVTGWAFDQNASSCYGEWILPDCSDLDFTWWLNDVQDTGSNADVSYIADFSARELPAGDYPQELDVVAPGSWVVGPYPGEPGHAHLPWWSSGVGNGVPGQFFFIGGTSVATPHVAGIAALLKQQTPALTQAQIESILRSSADLMPDPGAQFFIDIDTQSLAVAAWGFDGLNAVGWGLVQADTALGCTP